MEPAEVHILGSVGSTPTPALRYACAHMAENDAPAEATPEPDTAPAALEDPGFGVISTEEVVALQGTGLSAPGPQAQPGKPLQSGHKGKATVRTRHPVDALEHNVDGVPVITSEGVEVSPGKVDDLLVAARTADVELEVI